MQLCPPTTIINIITKNHAKTRQLLKMSEKKMKKLLKKPLTACYNLPYNENAQGETQAQGMAGRKEAAMDKQQQDKVVVKVTVTKTVKIEVIRSEDKKTACGCCNTCKR